MKRSFFTLANALVLASSAFLVSSWTSATRSAGFGLDVDVGDSPGLSVASNDVLWFGFRT